MAPSLLGLGPGCRDLSQGLGTGPQSRNFGLVAKDWAWGLGADGGEEGGKNSLNG